MLKAIPIGFFEKDFSIVNDKGKITDLRFPWFREKALFCIENKEYLVSRDEYLASRDRFGLGHWFSLRSSNELIATAELNIFSEISTFSRSIKISHVSNSMETKNLGILSGNILILNNERIGSIERVGRWFERRFSINLPDEFSVAVQLFIFSMRSLPWQD